MLFFGNFYRGLIWSVFFGSAWFGTPLDPLYGAPQASQNIGELHGQVSVHFYSFSAESFPSEKQYMKKAIGEHILETLRLQKKIYIPEKQMFVPFRLKTSEIKDQAAYQKLIRRTGRNEETPVSFDFITSFFRWKGRDWVKISRLSPGLAPLEQRYPLTRQNIKKVQRSLRKNIQGAFCRYRCHPLFISTKPKNSSIYVNRIYLGVSPVQIEMLPPGAYEVEAFQEFYKKHSEVVNVPLVKKRYLSLQKETPTTNIFVETKPSGARVYLDITYKGRSPISIKNISQGRHQVKVVKEGFRSEQKSILVQPQKDVRLSFRLTSDMKKPLPANHAWGPLTYEHLYISSFVSSVVFFSLGIYFSVEASQTRERLLVSLNGRTPENYTSEDLRTIDQSKQEADQEETFSTSFYVVGGLLAGLGTYFLIKNLFAESLLMSSPAKDIGSVGTSKENRLFFSLAPLFTAPGQKPNYRFGLIHWF